jgi:hypothetical protein
MTLASAFDILPNAVYWIYFKGWTNRCSHVQLDYSSLWRPAAVPRTAAISAVPVRAD